MEKRLTSKSNLVVLILGLVLVFILGLISCSSGGGSGAGSVSAPSSTQGASSSVEQAASQAASTSEATSTSEAADASQAESSAEATPSNPGLASALIAESNIDPYSYADLQSDLEQLVNAFPSWVRLESIAKTFDDRDVYLLVIGNPEAENKVLIHGGIHAREYFTTPLVVRQAAAFLSHAHAGDTYNDTSYTSVLENNAIYLIPSVNPDGAAISQFGIDGIQTEATLARVQEIADLDGQNLNSAYLRSWKANANGVDLNRQFDAMWESYAGPGHPSSDHYKGEAPGSEPESAALIKLTLDNNFSRTISYHTHGAVIYWYFAQEGEVYDSSYQFAQEISAQTGYPLDANYQNLDPAGYKDWALESLGIPSLTVEVGWSDSPVPAEQFETIWAQNENVWEATLQM